MTDARNFKKAAADAAAHQQEVVKEANKIMEGTKPTPTQDELNRINLGEDVSVKESSGAPSEEEMFSKVAAPRPIGAVSTAAKTSSSDDKDDKDDKSLAPNKPAGGYTTR